MRGWLDRQGVAATGPYSACQRRDPGNSGKLQALEALARKLPGQIGYFKVDLLEQGSSAQAMRVCEAIFHAAPPCASACG